MTSATRLPQGAPDPVPAVVVRSRPGRGKLRNQLSQFFEKT